MEIEFRESFYVTYNEQLVLPTELVKIFIDLNKKLKLFNSCSVSSRFNIFNIYYNLELKYARKLHVDIKKDLYKIFMKDTTEGVDLGRLYTYLRNFAIKHEIEDSNEDNKIEYYRPGQTVSVEKDVKVFKQSLNMLLVPREKKEYKPLI